MNDEKIGLILIALLLLVSEISYTTIDISFGLYCYGIVVAGMIISLIFTDQSRNVNQLLQAIMILPVIRFVGSCMPIRELSPFLRVPIVYLIFFIPVLIVFYYSDLDSFRIGIRKKGLYLFPVAIILGAILGFIEYYILAPERIVDEFTFENIFIGTVNIAIITGFIEEFMFRGLIQNFSKNIFKRGYILYTNIIFATMHLVWGSYIEIGFVFLIGLLFSFIYLKTKNLIIVSTIHASINFFLYIIYPILGVSLFI